MKTKTKTFKKVDIQAAVWKNTDEDSPLILEHAGEWLDKGKYQCQENILKDTTTGKIYRFDLSKSGSHFTEYTYCWEWLADEIKLTEVVEGTKTIIVWLAVEDK